MFESLQATCYGVVSSFFVLSTITIILRIYSRGFIVKSFGWDDWCMASILVFNSCQQAILYYFIHEGGGLHVEVALAEDPSRMKNLTYGLFVEEIYYTWMHWVIKTAFLLFYLRFATKIFRTLVYCTVGLNTIFTLIIWLMYCFQCMPLDAFFNPAAHPTTKCLDNSILAFVPAAFSIFTDLLIVTLPIQPLWAIQVSLRKRLMLISIVSLGGVEVLVSLLRLIVLREFQKGTDFTYVLGKLIIISSVEIEVAIICANAPSLKIFWAKHISKSIYGTGKEQYDQSLSPMSSRAKSGRRSIPQGSYIVSSSFNPPVPRGTVSSSREELRNESEETLAKHDSGIVVTQSVGVETSTLRGAPGVIRSYNHFDSV